MVDSVLHTQPANLEWQGKLAESVNSKALFSLYLAMHNQPGSQAITFHSESNAVKEFDVSTLNHYRRPPHASSDRAVQCLKVTNQLVHQRDLHGLLLWQSMHPDPLNVVDNAKKLPPDVKANCSFLTQHLLTQHSTNQIAVDETRLDNIVKGSAEFLN